MASTKTGPSVQELNTKAQEITRTIEDALKRSGGHIPEEERRRIEDVLARHRKAMASEDPAAIEKSLKVLEEERKRIDQFSRGAGTARRDRMVNGRRLKLDDVEWSKVDRSRRFGDRKSHLRIRTPARPLDPVQTKALAQLRAACEYQVDEDALYRSIHTAWFSEISDLTKRLNQSRMSDVRRHVLAAVYPRLLESLVERGDGIDWDDTAGLAQEIIHQLEEDDGPLHRFAAFAVDEVGRRNRLDLKSDDMVRTLLVRRVMATL